MNKAYFLPLVLTAAVASVASADTYTDQYTNVFTGVTSVSGLPAGLPTATGATWSKTGGDVALEASGGAVGFESEDSAVLKLTVASDPQDTNTIFKVAVSGTIEEVAELMNLAGANAQTALAICTYSFNAWNGSAWVALNEVPEGFDGSVPTNLLVEIKYQGTNTTRKVRFTVGNTTLSPRGAETDWINLGTSANNLTGFGVNGSGTLAAVNGDVMLGFAEYDGVKYGTLAEAVAKAQDDAEIIGKLATPISVVRETSEDVSVTSAGVIIADNGNVKGAITVTGDVQVDVMPNKDEFTNSTSVAAGASGTYAIPVSVSGGKLNVALPSSMSNKEVVEAVAGDGVINVTIQTATSVLEGAMPDGSKALDVNANLRGFLSRNASTVYNAADVTSESIADALAANGANSIPLYQSYALGIEPNVSVKPVTKPNPTSEEQTAGITLYIPNLVGKAGSGDYTIKYKVGDSEQAGGAGSITIPTTGTGSYEVKIVFQ